MIGLTPSNFNLKSHLENGQRRELTSVAHDEDGTMHHDLLCHHAAPPLSSTSSSSSPAITCSA